MNKEAQELLSNLLKKQPYELTSDEIGFLKARQSYLKKFELKEFESVLLDYNVPLSVDTEEDKPIVVKVKNKGGRPRKIK